jgi:arsenite transporter
MFQQIALFVFLPLGVGMATQYVGRRKYGAKIWNERIGPKFPPFSALGVILIAFVAMALKAKTIVAHPGDIVTILIPLAVFYLATYVLLSITGRIFFKREDAVAMVFGVVMRDLSIALAIAMTAFGSQGLTLALLISLAYVIQIQSAAWYVRFVDRIFGKTVSQKPSVAAVPIARPAVRKLHPAEDMQAAGSAIDTAQPGAAPFFQGDAKMLKITTEARKGVADYFRNRTASAIRIFHSEDG